jgi:hypothetical protein
MHVRAIVAALLGAVAITCAAGNPTYSIDAHIISTGTSVHATSVCFGLDAVIAEPVAGFSSGRFYITHSITISSATRSLAAGTYSVGLCVAW